MRCSSTVSAPVQHCCAPLTAHHSRYIAVQLLTNKVLYFIAETKSKAKDVYAQTCIYLAEEGMLDCELFGLAIMCDGEYLFVDPECKLSKYAPKNWKSSSSHGLDGHGKPVFVLYFRIQFYVDTPILLRDNMTRHNYYLQLRDNAISRGHVSFCSSDELLLLLGGYALQADFGDYNEIKHRKSYFQLEKYFPKELISRNSHILKTAVALHKENRGLTSAEAELQYIKEATSNNITPLSLNVHLYKLKSHKKQEISQTMVWLAICTRGIQIFEDIQSRKSLSTTFLWNNIGKLCFDRKKFEIKGLAPSTEKLTYYTSSDQNSKHLLFLCRVTHQFHMAVQSKLLEVKKKEEERKKFKDCFSYNRGFSSEYPPLPKINSNNLNYKNMRSNQRISVISNTSSNTTSGIVSDKVQSLDESEDDLEMEIMINSPPGNSVESLSLAHLKDGLSTNESNSSNHSSLVNGNGSDPTLMNHVGQKSPSSGGGAVTPATTDGSQCSSSCSTVIVAGTNSNFTRVNMLGPGSKLFKTNFRRNSTSSSLELGYSHRAENSFVSDSMSCLELDFSAQSARFGSTENIENESAKTPKVFLFRPALKNLATSCYFFKCDGAMKNNFEFQSDINNSILRETNTKVSAENNSKISNSYENGGEITLENACETERECLNGAVSLLGSGSDVETASSGIYETSNNLDSNRMYSSVDLENASSGFFTMRSGTEPDLQTNACSSETSGVYLTNSLADTSSASECCGIYEGIESLRNRSGSNASAISASGSFHGDGSDPSEAGKGSLLTAEELSDLIVGKTHNSGSYPLRASISNTLDSDSDYVTLPPPPRPPVIADTGFNVKTSQCEKPHSSFFKNSHLIGIENALKNSSHRNSLRRHQVQAIGIPERPQAVSLRNSSTQISGSLNQFLAHIRSEFPLPCPIEEANARFITTKPHFSMITHSNISSGSTVEPNYATYTPTTFALNYCQPYRSPNENLICPTFSVDSMEQGSNTSLNSTATDKLSSQLNVLSLSQKHCLPRTETTVNFANQKFYSESKVLKQLQNNNNSNNVNVDPGAKMKLPSLSGLPIVGKNNYLDVHASKAKNILPVKNAHFYQFLSPLSSQGNIPRTPPPPPPLSPPPTNLATVYTSQVTRSQIEQFKQQLYSDVDYVIYPMKDPAISKQEYIDAKQGSLLAALASGYEQLYPPPPPYPAAKTHVFYRSTPNVASCSSYIPLNLPNQPFSSIYSSNSHLSQSSEQLYGCQTQPIKHLPQPSQYSSLSPLYSAASYSSSSSQSLRYDPPQIGEYFKSQNLSSVPAKNFSRAKSDDNILNAFQSSKNVLERIQCRRFPPPPPPPYEVMNRKIYKLENSFYKANPFAKFESSGSEIFGGVKSRKKFEDKKLNIFLNDSKSDSSPSSSLKKSLADDKGKIIDIHALIEKSKNLDLPLISALCNDKSLLRQTNAFVMPQHPGTGRCSSGHGIKNVKSGTKRSEKDKSSSFHSQVKNSNSSYKNKKIVSDFNDSSEGITELPKTSKTSSLLETLFASKTSKKYASSSKLKYPVSGLSTTQISKPKRKLSSAHIHPNNSKPKSSHINETMTSKKAAAAIKNKHAFVP